MTRTAAPPLTRRLMSYEAGMWRSLFRWILRRPRAGPGEEAFGYTAAAAPILWAFVVLSAIEIPAVDLILPWQTVRLVAGALGAYGLTWMVGMVAGFRVNPHVVGDSGLRVRHGITVDFTLPWDAIATIGTRNRSLTSSRTVQYDRTGSDPVLHVVMLSQTNVHVVLRYPITVPLPKGDSEPFTELRFYADDPKKLVARARERLMVHDSPPA